MKIESLGELKRFIAALGDKQWKVVRAREGYYYFVHPEHMPTTGVYTYSWKGTTYEFWQASFDELTREAA
jgi:hypothetical protein